MKRIRFSAAYPERLRHPLHEAIAGDSPIRRAELLMWSPTADATTLLWFDGDADATASVVDAVDSLVASELVEGGGGTYAFLRQESYEFAPAVLDAIAAARVAFLPPVVFLDTGAVRFEAVGETGALGAFHEALADL
ncbi:bacterio-opsin activator, partial [Halorubrum sp. E3]